MNSSPETQLPLHGKPKQRILFSRGFWWYQDPENKRMIRLDPLFEKCGWKVGRLCEELGIGKRTFARMVEENLGVTSKVWLRQIRAVAACHLLREGSKANSVATRLGFLNYTDFSTEFNKMVGVSPSFYMKAEYTRSHGYLRHNENLS